MSKKVIQIGTVKTDSGKLTFCDPLYLQDWKNHPNLTYRKYKHIQTGKIYTYGQDFQNFSEAIDNKTIQELIKDKILLRLEEEPTNDFSYQSINKNLEKEGYYQSLFSNGKTGMAVTILIDNDGEYPVYAELEDDTLKKIWIDF